MKRLINTFFFFITCFLFAQEQFSSEPYVRVRIINSMDSLQIVFNSDWILENQSESISFSPEDELIVFTRNGKLYTLRDGETKSLVSFSLKELRERGTLKIKDVPYGVGWWWENKDDRIYEGEFRFNITPNNKIEVVVRLPLEKYLKGVVPYEIGNNSPLEALKAQAIAARSEAIMALNSKLYSGEHYDLTSDVECQVFSGNAKRTALSDQAVEETRSLILSENGKAINAYYASNCGGHSELIKNVWGDRPGVESYAVSNFDSNEFEEVNLSDEQTLRDWLFSNVKSNCNPKTTSGLPAWNQNNFRWRVEYQIESISKMIAKSKSLGVLNDINILQRGESGRAVKVKFIFEKESMEVTGELKIRQMFTPPLKSSCFVVDKTDSSFVLFGAGWGHGVGMCQSGAIGMANSGKSYEEILKHYYRKAEIIKIY